ncbi:hypothetical protein ElyMa_005966500 [Elysia marginata]|uniref:Uncharacterized protein n=1 Tax=Elysia marginata TaxID=1093978 RepID=A0AAV4GCV9_9GAST|nr:hypothetical protein ElyMa_005966500 [Elysia marginata]
MQQPIFFFLAVLATTIVLPRKAGRDKAGDAAIYSANASDDGDLRRSSVDSQKVRADSYVGDDTASVRSIKFEVTDHDTEEQPLSSWTANDYYNDVVKSAVSVLSYGSNVDRAPAVEYTETQYDMGRASKKKPGRVKKY